MNFILSLLDRVIAEEAIFWYCAFFGSILFAIQLLFHFLGAGGLDLEDGSGGFDSVKFKWLFKQALTGFLMMFGWVGLTCRREFELSITPTILLAFLGGFFAVWLLALIFRSAKKLQSSGTVFSLESAIGKRAAVYQRIPKGGVGKISLCLEGMTHEIDAVAHGDEAIDSFLPVQIIQKIDDKTVVVVPVN